MPTSLKKRSSVIWSFQPSSSAISTTRFKFIPSWSERGWDLFDALLCPAFFDFERGFVSGGIDNQEKRNFISPGNKGSPSGRRGQLLEFVPFADYHDSFTLLLLIVNYIKGIMRGINGMKEISRDLLLFRFFDLVDLVYEIGILWKSSRTQFRNEIIFKLSI